MLALSTAFLFSFCQIRARFSEMAFAISASAACDILIFNSRASDKRRVRKDKWVAFFGADVDERDVVTSDSCCALFILALMRIQYNIKMRIYLFADMEFLQERVWLYMSL